jgi:hypothetical protein
MRWMVVDRTPSDTVYRQLVVDAADNGVLRSVRPRYGRQVISAQLTTTPEPLRR